MRKIYAVRTTFALSLITFCAIAAPSFAQQDTAAVGTASATPAASAGANPTPGSVGGPASSDAGKASYMSAGAVTGGATLNSQASGSPSTPATGVVPTGAPLGTPAGVPAGASSALPAVTPPATSVSSMSGASPVSVTPPGAPSPPAPPTATTTTATQSTEAQPSAVVEQKTTFAPLSSKYDGIAVMVGFFLALVLLGVIFMFVGMKPKD